jgi:hypothetical protein
MCECAFRLHEFTNEDDRKDGLDAAMIRLRHAPGHCASSGGQARTERRSV